MIKHEISPVLHLVALDRIDKLRVQNTEMLDALKQCARVLRAVPHPRLHTYLDDVIEQCETVIGHIELGYNERRAK